MAKKHGSKTSSTGGAATPAAPPQRWYYVGQFCGKMKLHSTGETIVPAAMLQDDDKILAFQKKYPKRAHWFVKK